MVTAHRLLMLLLHQLLLILWMHWKSTFSLDFFRRHALRFDDLRRMHLEKEQQQKTFTKQYKIVDFSSLTGCMLALL
jgi:hypothetical protein